jgi:hypothetical protein
MKPRRISINGYLPPAGKRQRKKAHHAKILLRHEGRRSLQRPVGVDFGTNAEAITHCKEMAKFYRDNGLRDDQDLEITVVNEVGREGRLWFTVP